MIVVYWISILITQRRNTFPLLYNGCKKFHEGEKWPALGVLESGTYMLKRDDVTHPPSPTLRNI